MDNNYKLVHSVDPTKCRPRFREKFAKLTLSSNKKKQEEAKAQHEQAREQAMQSNVSRNLLSELLTDDESDGEKAQPQNLLLRTDSSPSDGSKRKTLNSTDATHCSEVEQDPEKSFYMEPLIMSVKENSEINDVIEKLSSRLSSLAVGGAPSQEKSIHELSQIVSTESQKMCGIQRFSDLLRSKCKTEPVVLISISLSSSSERDGSIISLSDTSEDEHEVNVSNSVASAVLSQTSALIKADRMAAFLRDVRRNYGLPLESPSSHTQEYENRQKEIARADTEPMTIDNDSWSPGTAVRIATADTESMTPEKEATEVVSNDTQKDASNRRLALDDTEDMTNLSESMQNLPHYAPVMIVASQLLDDSMHKSSDSIPDDSLTIAETSEEEQVDQGKEDELDQSNGESATQGALRPSASLSQLTSQKSSTSSAHETQFQINISAKINIKIQVSQHMDDSTSTEGSYTSTGSSPSDGNAEVDSPNENPQSSAQKAKSQTRALEDIPHSPPERDVPPKSPEPNKSPDVFLESAQRLLNELYGNTWKTPEVMRSLKKNVGPAKRRELPMTNECNLESPTSQSPREHEMESKNESALDDFSIFRRNIPQDLDSTRLPSISVTAFKMPKSTTLLRCPRKNNEVVSPQTEVTQAKRDKMCELEVDSNKPRKQVSPMKTVEVEPIQTKTGRAVRPRWRKIVNSDTESEGENASDKSWNMSDEDDAANKNLTVSQRRVRGATATNKGSELVYLDLSKDEVEVQQNISASPPANNDKNFSRRLDDILNSCKFSDKPKIECTPGGETKTKRKLFTANYNDDDENIMPAFDSPKERLQSIDRDDECVSMSGAPMPAKFEPFNKYLESVKLGKPIFKIQTPKAQRDGRQYSAEDPQTPKSATNALKVIGDLSATPRDKYGFLKSLDVCVGRSLCHPDALYYRDNFRLKKEELTNKLYEIYNQKCFGQELDVPIKWNKKLTNTAGRCMNKKRLGERTCCIELSEKVLTSADRLRCTLIHELCHAATWIFTGEGGHGATWKSWASKANQIFPELPKIGVCHQYDIEYKYTYKCTLCAAKSHAHSKSKKVENIRCSYCHGAIEVYLNRKNKDGNMLSTPVKEPTGFAKFVKDKYKAYKRPDLKHADVMKLLSNEFASLKVDAKS